jgi:DNA polymerase (family 10)
MSINTGRVPLQKASSVANTIIRNIGGSAMVCGSIRRKMSTVGDIDIVALETPALLKKLGELGFKIKDTVASSLINNISVSVYFADRTNWGSMIMHFTGSKAFNIMMRRLALKKGLTLNQYGVFNKGGVRIASRTENEIFDTIGMRHVKPVERNKTF